MNRKQLIVLWAAIIVIAIMIIFPPWRFHARLNEVDKYERGPYYLIFTGPEVTTYLSNTSYKGWGISIWKAEIDWVRLLLPIFVVALVASGLLVTLREKKPPTQ